MGPRKIEVDNTNNITKKSTFSRRRAGVFNRVDALTRPCNTEVVVLINSPAALPYVYGSPSSTRASKHIRDPSASSSANQSRILQAKLDSLMKELEEAKEHNKILKKRIETTHEKYNVKEIINPTLEDLDAYKKKLESLKDLVEKKCAEMESCPLVRAEIEKNKKNKVGLEFSSGESSLSHKIYRFPPTP